MSDETAPQPQIKITWLIGTLAAFAIFVVIGAYSARMTQTYPDYDQDRATQRYATLAEVKKAENALLYPVDKDQKPTAQWVDQTKGTVRIPIDEAMALEINTLKSEPPAMGAEIPPPAPPAPAKPAPAAGGGTNAGPAAPGAGPAPATSKPKTTNP